LAIGIENLKKKEYKIQYKMTGVFKVENDYWSLISSCSNTHKPGEIHFDVISSVYAKKKLMGNIF
jgi:hypothetical protein